MVVITYNQCLLIRQIIIFVVCKVPIYVANIFVSLQQNSKKSKYGRKCLQYWFQTEGGRNRLKYGSSRKIREIWWLWIKSRRVGVRDAEVTAGKKRERKCGTTGNKREYKMWDLIATTARRHEHNADDVGTIINVHPS